MQAQRVANIDRAPIAHKANCKGSFARCGVKDP